MRARSGRPPFFADPTRGCANVGTGVFYVPDGLRGDSRRRHVERAKAICRACPFTQVCARWALDTREPFGVLGGLSEEERRARWSANSLMPCGTRSARRRHAAQGCTCVACGVGYEPLPDTAGLRGVAA